MADQDDPVVCSLSPRAAADQLTEWSDLRRFASSLEPRADGVWFRLPLEHIDRVRDLIARESECCSFLRFDVSDTGESVELAITSPNPDGVPVVHLIAGLVEP